MYVMELEYRGNVKYTGISKIGLTENTEKRIIIIKEVGFPTNYLRRRC